ncbi:MAG: alpha/beta hydrolase family protein [Bacteroidales bacterium]|nr:alpha/beta hydrolase family protein [Bacteroidales bacterium]
MKKLIIYSVFCFLAFYTQASTVDTVMVHSKIMDKDVQVVTIVPDKASKSTPCPVVYLLHGYTGNAAGWIRLKPELKEMADQKNMIFICPGVTNSWYWDSPKIKTNCYETFMSKELIEYVDSHYPTKANRKARAISGLSMGGHGAMYLAMRHKDVFGAAGSMSGGLDIRPFPQNWEMNKLLGEEGDNRLVWDEYTAINQIERINNGDLALIIDCGYDDFFFKVNNDFHEKLLKHRIMHDFIVRAGAHTTEYWNNSIDYHLMFFQKFFNMKK